MTTEEKRKGNQGACRRSYEKRRARMEEDPEFAESIRARNRENNRRYRERHRERTKKYGEVFTPRWVAEKMIDLMEQEGSGAADIEATVFEPCCGEGAFITCVLRRKLARAKTPAQRLRACQTCYGIDIQYDNALACREKLAAIAIAAGVDPWDARFVFARNIIHGDMMFFPMIARFYDWKSRTWTTLERMARECPKFDR